MRLFSYRNGKRVKLDGNNMTFIGNIEGKKAYYRRENYDMLDIGLLHRPLVALQSAFFNMYGIIEKNEVNKHNSKQWLTEYQLENVDKDKYDTYWIDEEEYEDENTGVKEKFILHKAKKSKIVKSFFTKVLLYPLLWIVIPVYFGIRGVMELCRKKEIKVEVLKKI